MNEAEYILTHFYRRAPTPQGWIETVFVIRPKGAETHYLTFSGRVVPPEKIDNDVANGSLIALPVEYPIGREQSVWIASDQAIYLSDGHRPRSSNRVQVYQDNILSPYDAIDLAVQHNFEHLTSSLEVFFGSDTWKILLSVVFKYINNGKLNEDSFTNIGYIFPKLEAKYGDQFQDFLHDNLMRYSRSVLSFWDRQDTLYEWQIPIVDEAYDEYITESALLF